MLQQKGEVCQQGVVQDSILSLTALLLMLVSVLAAELMGQEGIFWPVCPGCSISGFIPVQAISPQDFFHVGARCN